MKLLEEMRHAGPEVFLIIGGPSNPTALMIEQCRRMGYKGGLILIGQTFIDYIVNVLKSSKFLGNLIGTPGASIPSRQEQLVAENTKRI